MFIANETHAGGVGVVCSVLRDTETTALCALTNALEAYAGNGVSTNNLDALYPHCLCGTTPNGPCRLSRCEKNRQIENLNI
jgi:hypothetical protein